MQRCRDVVASSAISTGRWPTRIERATLMRELGQ